TGSCTRGNRAIGVDRARERATPPRGARACRPRRRTGDSAAPPPRRSASAFPVSARHLTNGGGGTRVWRVWNRHDEESLRQPNRPAPTRRNRNLSHLLVLGTRDLSGPLEIG